ncbi:hypothetical protein DY000_02040755 [Brassica cretica]|uniref:Uncharacterized protein n=1 Tax=Brassica cretica TaxID=69181 RepID=A0ABQ7BPG8_BRACR|nr:hypothetical protein DY000_02040755 [Brassica cretica]
MRGGFFRANLALRAIRHISVFVIRAVTQLGYCRLRVLELGISPTALIAWRVVLADIRDLWEIRVFLIKTEIDSVNFGSHTGAYQYSKADGPAGQVASEDESPRLSPESWLMVKLPPRPRSKNGGLRCTKDRGERAA